jgi:hypothetical protein
MLGDIAMNRTQLLNDLEQLPPEALRQIENFVAFIKMRYQPEDNQRRQETIQDDRNIDSPR